MDPKDKTPWALRPLNYTHPCKLCTIRLEPGQPRLCPVCLERPEGKALLKIPPNARRPWSRREKRELRQLWPAKTIAEIATELGRTVQSVACKAAALRLPRKCSREHRYIWNSDQDDFLCAKYNSQPKRIDEICKALGVFPRWAIKKRARELGLSRTKEPEWTRREETFLARWLPHRSLEWIAKKLKRTITAISLKAKRLNIKKSGSGYTARAVAFGLGVDDHKVTRWIQNGLLLATRRETRRIGGQNGDYWFIDPSDLRDFIKENPDEISIRAVDKRFLIRILTTEKQRSKNCATNTTPQTKIAQPKAPHTPNLLRYVPPITRPVPN